jgi:preprotein translocase subunit SecF
MSWLRIKLWLANLVGFISAYPLVFVVGGVILLTVILFFSFCGKSGGIDQESINKINSANEAERKQELREVIEKNADTVKTVDNRTAITETNIEQRNQEIEAKIKQADKKILEAKSQGRDVTAEELEKCLLEGDCK